MIKILYVLSVTGAKVWNVMSSGGLTWSQ